MGYGPLLLALLFVFMVFGGPWMLLRMMENRRAFLLELKQQEARIAEAKAKELEIQHKRAELEYREALLELERFDRRSGEDSGLRPRPRLHPREPTDPPDPADPAGPDDSGASG